MRRTPDAATRNVERQAASPDSVLACYRRLIWLRKSSPALQTGEFAWEVRGRLGVLAYWRTAPDEHLLVAINTRSTPAAVAVPEGSWEVAFSTSPARAGQTGSGTVALDAYEAVILRPIPAD
jgi:alpha-glucosidase